MTSTTPSSSSHIGLQFQSMDLHAKPQDNFHEYANGQWKQNHPIPDEYPSWGVFMILRDRVLGDLRDIASSRAENLATLDANSLQAKIGRFWKAAMDEAAIEAIGLKPLQPFFDAIEKVQSVEEYAELLGQIHAIGASNLFSTSVLPDFKDSTMERLLVSQGGLGLPDREYYLDEEKVEIRQKYLVHVRNMLHLAGMDEEKAQANANTILRLETKLAQASKTRTEMRDIPALYNPQTKAALEAQSWPWKKYFDGLQFDMDEAPMIINATPAFFTFLEDTITVDTLSEWKVYSQWHLLRSMSSYLPDAFVQEAFNLTKVLSGTEKLEPRWKRVVSALNANAGELLGQVYCDEKFTLASKERALEMIEDLRAALKMTLENLEWMTAQTKVKAVEKLDKMGVKVGFPDIWIDYTELLFDKASYVENALEAQKFEHRRDMNRVNKPVESHRWEMPPQVVNAYYHPLRNEIVFPAAILQAPAFDASRDDALNYGAIGAVIGHEMTHGFDDQGRMFDANGNMVDWWQPEDADKFKALAQIVVDQYSEYEVCGRKVNGALTQGENIADIGGVKIAHRALELLYMKDGRPEKIEGYTGEQRFFLSYAQFWASNTRDEQALKLLAVDVHSPSELRAYCPLKNVDEFYKAFDVQEGDGMYLPKDKQMTIWG